jgi:ElaB/YqjD/DUF883 family membrane-anchored ribosome-binding protein
LFPEFPPGTDDRYSEHFPLTFRFNYPDEDFIRDSRRNALDGSSGRSEVRRKQAMSEFEEEVKKAEKELEQSLVPVVPDPNEGQFEDEFLGDLKMQAQDYGQRLQDVAGKAKVFAEEKAAWAGEKFKELQNKDPKELIEDAKEFARQKPGQTILISAAVGLFLGFLLKGRR